MSTDREKLGLKGAVQSVLIETARFETHDGQVTENPLYGQTMTLNEDGRLTEQISRNTDGSEWRTVFAYSDSGNLLATKTYVSSGELIIEMRFVYDDEERLVAEQHITPDGKVTTRATYTYDVEGGKTKIQELETAEDTHTMIGVDENIIFDAGAAKRIEIRYDERGKPAEVKAFDAAGVLVKRLEITRDAQGNALEETQYLGDLVSFGQCGSVSCDTVEIESLTEEQRAEFAAVVAQMFSPGKATSRHIHQYDAEGRLIESKLMMMGIVASHRTFSYDEAGNKSEEMSYVNEAFEGKTIFTRDYDEHGNWTKELVSTASNWDAKFELSTPAQVTRREIIYHQ